jgi:OmpA-OmpF porin, OOP family
MTISRILHARRVVACGVVLVALGISACESRPHTTAPRPGGDPPVVMPTGCGAAGAVVLGLAAHANTPGPAITARMQTGLQQAVAGHAAIGLVEIDGVPRLVAAGTFRSTAGNTAARDSDEQGFLDSLFSQATELKATRPHVNDLAALRVAAAAVRSACAAGGTVYLEDTGLQDTSSLNFAASDLLEARPSEVADFLRAKHELPDLRDIRVVWAGIGESAPPQQDLDQASRANLVAVWTAVLRAAGASSVFVDATPLQGHPPQGVPAVSTVRLPKPPVYVVPSRGTTVLPLPDSGPVGFLPDEALFRNPAVATAALRRLANALAAVPDARITLLGTTSSAGGTSAAAEAGRVRLSAQRAAAVRRELVRFGVRQDRISVRGVGTHFQGFEPDQDGMDNLLPGPAEHNRSVIVQIEGR